mgnify:CR=1 FL=1
MSDNQNTRLCWVGIDTSNYTTSAAFSEASTGVVTQQKQLLPVKSGEVGLRQSDAVFHHVRNLPAVMEQLRRAVAEAGEDSEIVAIGVSARPRDAEGSYMPCFLSGVAVATALKTDVCYNTVLKVKRNIS